MGSISLDETHLATLTPEEQAAISGDDYSEDELKTLTESAKNDNDDDVDDGDPNETLDADGNPVVTETIVAPANAPDPDATPAAEPEPEPAKAADPVAYDAKLPEDYTQKIDDLATQEAEIRAKFKSGEIELDAYETERDTIIAEREKLNTARIKHEISQEMTQQARAAAWQSQIDSFMADAAKPAQGAIDYRKDTDKANDLDLFVKTLANNPANADKPGPWFLNEAHKRVMALHGVTVAKPADPTPTPAAQTPRTTTPIKSAPKTLAQVPGADGPGDIGGEFTHLDALEGSDLEDAIAKMSPAMREKYSRGG